MNYTDFKNLEGQRVQAVLGAIGALPAAMLVFGDAPASAAPGAPLFAAAVVMVVGAYQQWTQTDACFYLDATPFNLPDESAKLAERWRAEVNVQGDRCQNATFVYGIASLFASMFGLAAVFSTLRSPVTVEVGFCAAVLLLGFVSWEVFSSNRKINALLHRCRALSQLEIEFRN